MKNPANFSSEELFAGDEDNAYRLVADAQRATVQAKTSVERARAASPEGEMRRKLAEAGDHIDKGVWYLTEILHTRQVGFSAPGEAFAVGPETSSENPYEREYTELCRYLLGLLDRLKSRLIEFEGHADGMEQEDLRDLRQFRRTLEQAMRDTFRM